MVEAHEFLPKPEIVQVWWELMHDAGDVGYFEWLIPEGVCYCTGFLRRLLPVDPATGEIEFEKFVRLVHSDDAARVRALLDHAMTTREEQLEYEFRLTLLSGTMWLSARARVEYGANGRPVRLFGINRDVTHLKEMEEALLTSDERLRIAKSAADLGIHDYDIETGVITWDARVRSLWGLGIDETVTYEVFLAGVHPEDRAKTDAAVEAALDPKGDGRFWAEYRVIHRATGRVRWVLATGQVLFRDGKGVRLVGTAQDITGPKEVEQNLRASEERLQLALEVSQAGTWDLDLRTGRNVWSKSHFRLVGLTPTATCEATPEMWRRAIVEDDVAEVVLEWQRAEHARDLFRSEHRLRRFDTGEVIWVRAVGQFHFDEHGNALRFIGAAQDITDRKRAEEALREADRRKDEFLAMLGHELRNPLAPIRNAVEILRLTRARDPVLENAREMIDRQVHQLSRLVDDLLDVSRVSRGKIHLEKSPVDLRDVARHAVETSRPLIDARRHELLVSVPEAPIRVLGDFTRLTQVVSNLLNNAAKYTDEGGRIWLTVEEEEGKGVLRVRDNGRGIEQEALANLFDLFYQVDRTLNRSEGGLGIGLSLVKTLVELHDGSVSATSAGRGKGSEFVIRLPRCPQVVSSVPRTVSNEGSNAKSFCVLVVDDNLDSASSLAMLLRFDGHVVHTAHDGRRAVEMALEVKPALVLLDIGLPSMDGYEACRAMHAGGLVGAMIVAVTGYGQEDDHQRAKAAGFDDHLVKPVDFSKLRDLLRRVEARRRER